MAKKEIEYVAHRHKEAMHFPHKINWEPLDAYTQDLLVRFEDMVKAVLQDTALSEIEPSLEALVRKTTETLALTFSLDIRNIDLQFTKEWELGNCVNGTINFPKLSYLNPENYYGTESKVTWESIISVMKTDRELKAVHLVWIAKCVCMYLCVCAHEMYHVRQEVYFPKYDMQTRMANVKSRKGEHGSYEMDMGERSAVAMTISFMQKLLSLLQKDYYFSNSPTARLLCSETEDSIESWVNRLNDIYGREYDMGIFALPKKKKSRSFWKKMSEVGTSVWKQRQ